jgi:hypothetical protein
LIAFLVALDESRVSTIAMQTSRSCKATPYQSDLVGLGCPKGHAQHEQSREEPHDVLIVDVAAEASEGLRRDLEVKKKGSRVRGRRELGNVQEVAL